jgi:hypothetical protein
LFLSGDRLSCQRELSTSAKVLFAIEPENRLDIYILPLVFPSTLPSNGKPITKSIKSESKPLNLVPKIIFREGYRAIKKQ